MDPNNWQTVWSMANTGFALPFNEWMQMEAYYREGNKTQGRFYLSVTRSSGTETVLFDVTNFTHHPMNMNPAGLKWINPMKLYCSKSAVDWVSSHQPTNGTLQVYWDDFEFWKYKKPQ